MSSSPRPEPTRAVRRRILLTGASGQVGRELARCLRPLGEVIAPSREPTHELPALDLLRPGSIRAAVRELRPQLIVNAAAYTAVDQAESEPERAMAVNAVAPGILAEEALRIEAALVHYSTDYVFDGGGTRPWREDDPTGPLNVYGQSKLAGEAAIRATGAAHLILRTSWVHSAHGVNFVKTMLRLAAERISGTSTVGQAGRVGQARAASAGPPAPLKVVHDQIGAPTSAQTVAEITVQILSQAAMDFAGFLRDRGGLLHLAYAGETCWHGFALEILRRAKQRGIVVAIPDVLPVPTSEYPTAARRPANSRLDCRRLTERFGVVLPHWIVGLEQTLNGIAAAAGWHALSTDAKGVLAPLHAHHVHVLGVPPTGAENATPSPRRGVGRGAGPATVKASFMQSLRQNLRNSAAALASPPADLDLGVIYTYERDWMNRLVPTLARSGDDLRLRLILVDNVSADGIGPWESHLPTTVLRNDRRLGYAPNLNRILEASTAPLVLLLNTDMEFDPAEQCLSKMVRFMRDHPDCGIAGCRLYHPDGTYGYPARRFQTLGVIAGRRTPLAPLCRQAVDRYCYLDRPHTAAFECDWLSGCFLLVRRAAYEQVGPFDCRFAKYFEDVDICLRMARAGWRVMFNGGTYCYHGEERASRRVFSRDALLHLRSYYRWIKKWGLRPDALTRRVSEGEAANTSG